MAMTDAQIARILLGALVGEGVNATEDDIDEIILYVDNGFEYLEERHVYDPKQFGVTAADIAVQYYAGWRFCSVRPSLIELAQYYKGQFELATIEWTSRASIERNIEWMEYPENQGRTSYNNTDPLGQLTDIFGVDRNRIGT